QFGVFGQSPARLHALVTDGKKLANNIRSMPPNNIRNLLSSVLERVIIGEDLIELMVSRMNLHRLLTSAGHALPMNQPKKANQRNTADLICLKIEARLKRSGGTVHLIVSPSATSTQNCNLKPALLKALARANSWYQSVREGQVFDHRTLAN